MAMETMNAGSTRTLSAMFDTREEADRAVAALKAAGVADVVLTGGDNSGSGSGFGSGTGGTTSGTRSEDRGFFESIGDFFFPEEDRYAYAEGLNRGGYLVTVSNIPAEQYETALDILDNEGAVDLDAREAEWRSQGWSGYSRDTSSADSSMSSTSSLSSSSSLEGTGDRVATERHALEGDTNNDGRIDIVEERVMVAKRETAAGRVRVRSYVTETPVEQDIELRSERVHVDRRPVDRPAGDADFQERTLEAREYTETPVVQKEARVVEEINLNKEVDTRVETVRDTVRKTEVEIEDERGTVTDRGTMTDRGALGGQGSLSGEDSLSGQDVFGGRDSVTGQDSVSGLGTGSGRDTDPTRR